MYLARQNERTCCIAGFRCDSDGFHADPAHCGAFYECRRGLAHRLRCAPGLAYRPALRACDRPPVPGTCGSSGRGGSGRPPAKNGGKATVSAMEEFRAGKLLHMSRGGHKEILTTDVSRGNGLLHASKGEKVTVTAKDKSRDGTTLLTANNGRTMTSGAVKSNRRQETISAEFRPENDNHNTGFGTTHEKETDLVDRVHPLGDVTFGEAVVTQGSRLAKLMGSSDLQQDDPAPEDDPSQGDDPSSGVRVTAGVIPSDSPLLSSLKQDDQGLDTAASDTGLAAAGDARV